MSKSNQSWLEAYEAQKAKRLESMKNGPKNPFSLSGLEKTSTEKPKSKPSVNKLSISTNKPSNSSTNHIKTKPVNLMDIKFEGNQIKNEPVNIRVENCDNLGTQISNLTNRPRKNSVDNSIHERFEAEKLASIEAFSQPPRPVAQCEKPKHLVKSVQNPTIKSEPEVKPLQNPIQKPEQKRKQNEEPSVQSLFKKAKVDAKKDVKDWQKEYEERKRLAMEKLKK